MKSLNKYKLALKIMFKTEFTWYSLFAILVLLFFCFFFWMEYLKRSNISVGISENSQLYRMAVEVEKNDLFFTQGIIILVIIFSLLIVYLNVKSFINLIKS